MLVYLPWTIHFAGGQVELVALLICFGKLFGHIGGCLYRLCEFLGAQIFESFYAELIRSGDWFTLLVYLWNHWSFEKLCRCFIHTCYLHFSLTGGDAIIMASVVNWAWYTLLLFLLIPSASISGTVSKFRHPVLLMKCSNPGSPHRVLSCILH